jgi:hypothetical protein
VEPLSLDSALAAGNAAAQACTEKATARGFSTDAAMAFALNYLREYGSSWGEDIVDAAKAAVRTDLQAHDGRAWGSVFSTLARRNRIRCVRSDGIRRHGHGTTGARQWALVQ